MALVTVLLRRITAAFVAAAIAGSGAVAFSTAPAGAATGAQTSASGCLYKVRYVKSRLNVRKGPSTRARVIDKLYPRQVTRGKCKRYGKWRKVQGDHGRKGYSHGHYLKKLRRSW